ncbi:MAG: site-specific DNA-methyltransferase [Spirochaetes bacterium]|nr:site-specific DNA-methyltransferase [Spirochaetota bacterium]
MAINKSKAILNPVSPGITDDIFIDKIAHLDYALEKIYKEFMRVDNALNRKLVSFQANKTLPFYRWYKYKEGFSSFLVEYYIYKRGLDSTKKLLDPFAGSGAALFCASDLGIDSLGIELLPIGQHIIKARNLLNNFAGTDFKTLVKWKNEKPWINHQGQNDFTSLKITDGAYPQENSELIKKFLSCMQNENKNIQAVLLLALFCILESISFTRKDGQYLRWDRRSGRCLGAIPFEKGEICEFNDAMINKLEEIIQDVKGERSPDLFDFLAAPFRKGHLSIIGGSCLQELTRLDSNSIDLVVTSPPYCNRYDYTRTYALELAMLGVDEAELLKLRQEMLSCTVENREKDLLALNHLWASPLSICNEHKLLQKILEYLYSKKENKTLNNNGIPRMIKGYFYEMSCVIYELYRILAPSGEVVMVNDNVRYAGASISVDLILSDIAAKIGFQIQEISILPIGKGNSSQQMGAHGRETLRKCVYIWRKK